VIAAGGIAVIPLQFEHTGRAGLVAAGRWRRFFKGLGKKARRHTRNRVAGAA
jgi:hypothetical protein